MSTTNTHWTSHSAMKIQSTKTQIHRHFSALLQPIWREREQLPCKSHHTGTFSGVLCQLSAVMTPLHTVRSVMRIKGLAICCYYCYCFSPVCSQLQQKRCCCCFLGADAMTIGFQLQQQIETHSRDRRAQKRRKKRKREVGCRRDVRSDANAPLQDAPARVS